MPSVLALAAGVLIGSLGPGSPATAGIILQVDTAEDVVDADGDCSLREAILAANANAITDGCGSGTWSGADSIRFSLGSGSPVIHVVSNLPAITEQVTIAGNTGGATRIVLDGPGSGTGLRVLSTAASSTLRHLVIADFEVGVDVQGASTRLVSNFIGTDATGSSAAGSHVGIFVDAPGVSIGGTSGVTPGGSCTGECNLISGNTSGVRITAGSSATIRGNHIGTDLGGTFAIGNGDGIRLEGDGGATIGGAAVGAGNLVSGNGTGISLQIAWAGAVASTIQGNRIGTNASGTGAVPNGVGVAIDLDNRAYAVEVGGGAAGEGNLISGNLDQGILLTSADDVAVQGNLIGTQIDGATPLANGGAGVDLGASTHDNLIGGTGAGEGNVIAHNAVGMRIGINNYYNQVRGNSIHDNAGAGIVLDDDQAFTAELPVVTGADPISGTACPSCSVDVHSDADDEGAIYEGTVTANGAGQWAYPGPVSGPNVTATATSTAGSTSEFSVPLPEPAVPLALPLGVAGIAALHRRRMGRGRPSV